jgi:hypothetical protein
MRADAFKGIQGADLTRLAGHEGVNRDRQGILENMSGVQW